MGDVMETTFIQPDQSILLWTILVGVTAFSLWAGTRGIGRHLGGAVIAIIGGFVLGNLSIIPTSAPVYTTVWEIFVPLAIPLFLFQADIRKIMKEAGPTLMAFLIGAIGTTIGALIAFTLIQVPEAAEKVAAIFAATFIGGGMNFAAVSTALEFPNPDLLLASAAADNIITILFLFVLGLMPSLALFRKFYPMERKGVEEPEPASQKDHKDPLNFVALLTALSGAFLLMQLGEWVQEFQGWPGTAILVTTLVSVALATAFPKHMAKLVGSFDLGMVLMFIFFVSLGASANVMALIASGPIMFLYAIVVVAIHAVILFGLGKVFKFTLPELVTASNACILGPATAAGLAANKGWTSLVTPGILVGVLGYAIANFIGIGIGNFLG